MGGTEQDRARRPGGISRTGASARMRTATEATPEMAAYFLGALRDQSSRAVVFQRQIRWQRLRHALATEEAAVADQHRLDKHLAEAWASEAATVVLPLGPVTAAAVEFTTSAEPPEPSQVVAG